MKSTFKLASGGSITVEAKHASKTILIKQTYPVSWTIQSDVLVIPADLAGVIAQAIELAGEAILKGPCSDRNIPGFNWLELGGTVRHKVPA